MTEQQFTVLGAYALVARIESELKEELYNRLPFLGVDALEIPVSEFVEGAQRANKDTFNPLDLGLDSVVTMIPSTMQKLGKNMFYGLASTDEAGRQEAVRDIVEVLELSDRLSVAGIKGRLRAIQVHSAPRSHRSSVEAFESSLRDILTVTPSDVSIVIEHCDAPREGRPFAKGFLELSSEIAAVQRINDSRLGIAINWGRSAIEGQTAAYVDAQISEAAASGVLKGLMFSGVAEAEGVWGPPWDDSHIAPRGVAPALAQSAASLLGEEEFKSGIAAAQASSALSYVGVKITVLDAESDVERCYEVAQESLKMAGLI